MELVSVKKNLFGGEIEFVVYGMDEFLALEIIEDVYLEGLRLQKIFNFYDPKSELSKLNSVRSMEVSDELLYVIKNSIEYSKLYPNYDVSLGKFILMRKKGEIVSPTCSYKDISITGNKIELFSDDVVIDLGSVAKGYITDKMFDLLLEKGACEFMIDARGDIRVSGKYSHIISIQDPRGDGVLANLSLRNYSVATSGDYSQYTSTFDLSHIINQKDFSSVTVIAETLMEADIFATLLFTSSIDEIEDVLEKNKRIRAFCVDRFNNIKMFNCFESFIKEDKNEE